MGSAKAFPNLNADGIDSNDSKYGADGPRREARQRQRAHGQCYGGARTDLACASDADCPPRVDGIHFETAFCELIDDDAEYCNPAPHGDDLCGAAGTDEPDETFLNNVFFAADSGNKIYRGITNPSDLTQLVRVIPVHPHAQADRLLGLERRDDRNDGYLLARNTGAATGGLYRIIYDASRTTRSVGQGIALSDASTRNRLSRRRSRLMGNTSAPKRHQAPRQWPPGIP
jgi:hypothetical protein